MDAHSSTYLELIAENDVDQVLLAHLNCCEVKPSAFGANSIDGLKYISVAFSPRAPQPIHEDPTA
jgi:hypothetical protein